MEVLFIYSAMRVVQNGCVLYYFEWLYLQVKETFTSYCSSWKKWFSMSHILMSFESHIPQLDRSYRPRDHKTEPEDLAWTSDGSMMGQLLRTVYCSEDEFPSTTLSFSVSFPSWFRAPVLWQWSIYFSFIPRAFLHYSYIFWEALQWYGHWGQLLFFPVDVAAMLAKMLDGSRFRATSRVRATSRGATIGKRHWTLTSIRTISVTWAWGCNLVWL